VVVHLKLLLLLLLLVVVVTQLLLLHALLLLLLLLLRMVAVGELVGDGGDGRQRLEWRQSGVRAGITSAAVVASSADKGRRMRRHPGRSSATSWAVVVAARRAQRLQGLVAGLGRGVDGPVVGRVQHRQAARRTQFAGTEQTGIGRPQRRIDATGHRMLLLLRMVVLRVVVVLLLVMVMLLLEVVVRMVVVRMDVVVATVVTVRPVLDQFTFLLVDQVVVVFFRRMRMLLVVVQLRRPSHYPAMADHQPQILRVAVVVLVLLLLLHRRRIAGIEMIIGFTVVVAVAGRRS
jgi:hypothetical protein